MFWTKKHDALKEDILFFLRLKYWQSKLAEAVQKGVM